MRVSKIRRLPKKAGAATLAWFDDKGRLPSREGSKIRLRKSPDSEFYPLHEGEQFLYRLYPQDPKDYVWFGGMDEAPFLTALKPQAFLALKNGGEQAFYDALKPGLIARVELFWGKDKTRRQGDIFAYPMPHGWDAIFAEWSRYCVEKSFNLQQRYSGEHGMQVLNTRHEISGMLFTGNFWLEGIGPLYANNHPIDYIHTRMVLGEGRLTAPDHKPLELKGPHIIMQASLLQSPDHHPE